jgi:integrase
VIGFFFALLFGTGMRVGQALGLRHCDFVSHERRVEIVSREDNANRARGKGGEGSVPISGELVRLHSDYMHEEYGELDSDYVFVNLWAGQIGRRLRYANVVEIVERTRRRVGFHFTAHMFRHTYATLARRGGVPLDLVSRLLLRTFLDDVRMHEWAPGLAGNATYFDGEIPRGSTRRLPRFIDEFVMGQIESEHNLVRLPDLTTQTAIVILIETGWRSIDALRLPFDPITVDAAGAPYLLYTNHKLGREAVIPISQRLLEQIRRQQTDVARRYTPEQRHYLLPAVRSNPDGRLPLSWDTLRRRLARWLRDCEIRDATGGPVHITPHPFRHTLATRLVNSEVPLDTVRRLLDHNSPEMTAPRADQGPDPAPRMGALPAPHQHPRRSRPARHASCSQPRASAASSA